MEQSSARWLWKRLRLISNNKERRKTRGSSSEKTAGRVFGYSLRIGLTLPGPPPWILNGLSPVA
jgi:hypothetical protein